jgi:hypothetical protein
MVPAPDVGRAVTARLVADRQIDDSEVSFRGAEKEFEISKRIEVAEAGPRLLCATRMLGSMARTRRQRVSESFQNASWVPAPRPKLASDVTPTAMAARRRQRAASAHAAADQTTATKMPMSGR